MKKIVFIIYLFLYLTAAAQEPDMVFHNLTEKDGLSFNIVNCFFKDSEGILWIGTYNGLNRYDGAHFYIYKKGKSKSTLPDNTVHKLTEDKEGNIWGGTDNGIFCYNKKMNSFKRYETPFVKNWFSVSSILCDQQGTIWAGNVYCLVKYNAQADSFEKAPIKIGDKELDKDYNIRKNGLVESPDGKGLWLATNKGLLYYDKANAKMVSSFNHSDTVLFTKNSTAALCATKFGHFWFYDDVHKHLVCFDPTMKKVKKIVKPKEAKGWHYVATVFEDDNHLLWASTWQYMIFNIDYLHGNKQTEIMHDKNILTSIAGDFVWDIMQESDGTIWFGTVGGISRCNLKNSFYKVHRFDDSSFTPLNPSIIHMSENTKDATWWIATNKHRVLHYNPITKKSIPYELENLPRNKKGLPPKRVYGIEFMNNDVLLFTQSGAWIKKENATFKAFELPGLPDTIMLNEGVMLNDSILFVTDNSRLWKWNINQKILTEITFKSQIKTVLGELPYISYLTISKNKLWTLNGNGWISYLEGNQLVPTQFSDLNEEGRIGYYSKMSADSKGNLWIAKKGTGLLYYNPYTKESKIYHEYDGLASDHIMTSAVDNNDKVWTTSYNKFSVFNPLLNSFLNFKLPFNENNYLYSNYSIGLGNGNIITSIADKIIEFIPSKINTYVIQFKPIIGSVAVAGNERILNKDNSLMLRANENSIRIKFGLLTDYESIPYTMVYILDGAEKNWSQAGSNFEASYNNLASGDYLFKVKAIAKDKSWQTKESILKIHIATPFYKSWWFITILVFITACCIYFLYRYRLQQNEKMIRLEGKAQLLEKEKTMVMYESLKQQLNPHFLFNSLTSLSGLIQLDQNMAGEFLEQMSGIYRYILKHGNSEIVTIKEELEFVNLYVTLQQTRFKKGLNIDIHIPEEFHHYKIAPVTLQNLIENALKHNIIDAESPLMIEIYIEDEYIVVKNNLQLKNKVESSNKKGLKQFETLYSYLIDKPIFIEETSNYFIIKIPLI